MINDNSKFNSKSRFNLIYTEQGHPMSPELFKCFINDLWQQLISLSVPVLDGAEIWHLFWADDLVLMALDNTSLQKRWKFSMKNALNGF